MLKQTSIKSVGQPGNGILLKCSRIHKSYHIRKREVPVLNGIDLSVRQGEIVVITGKSGAGKSTFQGILGGLTRPNSGSIVFDGFQMEALSNEKLSRLRRSGIGVVFQNNNLLPSWTALENVEAALMHQKIAAKDRREKATRLLDELGVGDKKDHLPDELSAGQQQRVAIARALVNDPSLILADEPTGEVDAETSRDILRCLIGPVREKGVTLVVTTHGVFPLDVADRVLYLKDGMVSA